jgi:hypothetical protein
VIIVGRDGRRFAAGVAHWSRYARASSDDQGRGVLLVLVFMDVVTALLVPVPRRS